jgi:peptidoglycan/xylan/chitin deacetylase (PgdA/CDA1 family)
MRGRPRSQRADLCVLVLHRVMPAAERPHDIAWTSFGDLLDLVEASRIPATASFDAPGVCLTFDDATADHSAVAEELARRGLPGVFFVPPGKLGHPGHLDEADVRRLCRSGHTVGAHGLRHIRLDDLPPPKLRSEVAESKRLLEQIMGSPVLYFAPPGGGTNARLRDELLRASYSAARGTRWGVAGVTFDHWNIPAVPVTELTLRRGWVETAIVESHIPLAMRYLGEAKSLMPARVHSTLRAYAHRGTR